MRWQGIFFGGVWLNGELRKFNRKVRSYTIFVPEMMKKKNLEK
jgi:hypothetical protein